MRKQLTILVILCIAISLKANQSIVPNAIVLHSAINLREAPSFAAEMATQELMGTPIHILENSNGWVKVITPDGYHAWTPGDNVIPMDIGKMNAWKEASKVIVTSYFCTLLERPNKKSAIISDVVMGNKLLYLGKKGSYYKLQLPDGRKGYLKRNEAQLYDQWVLARQATPESIIKEAKKMLGFPYVWGGTSIKGFDCSGLTQHCFYLNGVILPRNANHQAEAGINVDITSNLNYLQPADLLFFGSMKEGKEHITHVAIYMGNGDFIHASGNVHVNSLLPNDAHYDSDNAQRLLRAKRILMHIDQDPNIVSIKSHPFYIPMHSL